MRHEQSQQQQLEHLIRMANQIAANLSHGARDEQAVAAVASHLRRFWARPMKAKIIAHQQAGGTGLDPLAQQAVQRLSQAQGKGR